MDESVGMKNGKKKQSMGYGHKCIKDGKVRKHMDMMISKRGSKYKK